MANGILKFFGSGHERSILIKKNAIASLVLQTFNVIIQFALVPLTLNYLNPTKYGIWITLSSVILWLTFFDLGLSNGLKNKLAESLALKDYESGKSYISTTYFFLIIIALFLFVVFIAIHSFIQYPSIFNTTLEMADELSKLVFWVFAFFLLKFIFNIISIVFTSDQHPAYVNYFSFLANLASLIAIFIITKTTQDSLFLVGLGISIPTFLIPLLASIYYFRTKYQFLSPSFKSIDLKKIRPLFGLGLYFFIAQIMTLIIYSSDNMIILQVLGPEQVTPYAIAFKYFSIVTMLFGVALAPLWAAFTDAYSKEDYDWIRNTVKKFIQIWLVLIIGVVLMISCSNFIYRIWIGESISIPYLLSIFMGLFVIQNTWIIIFTYFTNGVGKMQLVTIILCCAGLLNIPLSIYLAKYMNMGATGVIIATILSLLPQSIIIPIQYQKIVNQKATGIWNQ